MNSNFVTAAIAAAPSAAPAISQSAASLALAAAARLLLADLERRQAIDAQALRTAMIAAFNGSDAEGAWTWKTAYDACEAAQILFLRKFGPTMRERAAAPSAFLTMLAKVAALVPSHTRRSEESQALQQFCAMSAMSDRRVSSSGLRWACEAGLPREREGLVSTSGSLGGQCELPSTTLDAPLRLLVAGQRSRKADVSCSAAKGRDSNRPRAPVI
jgi:protein strawberry notch